VPETSTLENILRRDQRVTAVGLAVLCALAWAYLIAGAGMAMSLVDMTSTALFPHEMAMSDASGAVTMPRWSATDAALMIAMWWVMMIAMMTPSAAPMVLLQARVARHAQASGKDPDGGLNRSGLFVAGYLFVWLSFAVVATGLQWGLEAGGLVSAMMMSSVSADLTAAVLITAGVYQWTPLKNACLRQCRAPFQFLSRHWRAGRLGAARLGVLHGGYCVGCCWALMALLFVGGVMNPIWIAALAAVVLLEKLTAAGALISRLVGLLLVAWGIAALVA
jgi:predicted metal-binding membrane protein